MVTSDKQKQMIKNHEGFSSVIYFDPPDQTENYSIGYGHYLGSKPEIYSMTITEANAQLNEDITPIEVLINKYLKNITQDEFDALIDLGYGAGTPKLKIFITKYLKNSDKKGAVNYIASTKYPGVNDRRKADIDQLSELFNPLILSDSETEDLENTGTFNPYFIPVFLLGIYGIMKITKIVN